MEKKRHHHSKITRHQENLLFHHYLENGNTLKYYAEEYAISIFNVKEIIERGFKKRAATKNAAAQNKN